MDWLDWLIKRKILPKKAAETTACIPLFSPPAETFDMKQAIDGHRTWCQQLYLFLKEKNAGIPAQFLAPRDDLCALGQWLHSNADALADLPEYRRLVESHALFHTTASGIARQYQSGQTDQALKTLKADLRADSEHVQLDIVRLYTALSKKVEA